MTFRTSSRRAFAAFSMALAFALVSADYADARRGGGFGSRGARTFQAPPSTATAPRQAAPIERSMTPRDAAQPQTAQRMPNGQPARRGLFGGFAGSMLGGLLVGGLLGMMLGHGFGGAAGMLGLLLQLGLIALVVMLVMRFLRRRRQQPAYAQASGVTPLNRDADRAGDNGMGRFDLKSALGGLGAGAGARSATANARPGSASEPSDQIGIGEADLDTFEQLLQEIQRAFAQEDYAALREHTTPEVMSYLSEELSQNATRGLKNDVSDVRLLQGDLAEAWREDGRDYATVAMRYSSVDVTRDRATGRIVEGDPSHPTETTEVWTFTRERGAPWKLSAIQDA